MNAKWISRFISSVFVLSLAASNGANAQCLDWKPGFGLPGGGVSGGVQAEVVFDDGSGPALYVGGAITQAGDVTVSNIAKWNGTSWSDVGGGTTGAGGAVKTLIVFDDGSGPAL